MTSYRRIIEHIPSVAWEVAVWPTGRGHVYGHVDAADRKRLVLTIMEAAQAAQDRPRSDEQATDVRPDRPTSPEPSDSHTHAALDAIREARTLAGRDAGTVWALTAIAHALLAQGQENR